MLAIWIEYLSSSYLNSKGMMKFEEHKATVCVSSKTKFVKIAISNNLQISLIITRADE